jgi:hypothetical protein
MIPNLWYVLVVQGNVQLHCELTTQIGQLVKTRSNTRTQTSSYQSDSSRMTLIISHWILGSMLLALDDGMRCKTFYSNRAMTAVYLHFLAISVLRMA